MTISPTLAATSVAIDSLVAAGRKKFRQLFEGTDQAFDDVVWNIGHLQQRLTTSENLRLYFTYYQSRDIPLPIYYAQVVKSWLLLKELSAKSRQECLDAARILWLILHKRRGPQTGSFCWQSLCEEDLRQTELWMQDRLALATVYRRTSLLLQFAAFLEGRQICRPLFYTVQAPCPSKAVCTLAAQEAQRSKLPSKRALNGLAEVYASLAQTPQDRLRAAATALLVVSGFRVGELLTLPVDCEVEEVYRGRQAYGLRYFKEKAKGSGKQYDIRWLTPLQAELARQAIREIRDITEPARQQAKILEENDPRVPVPGFAPTDTMTAADIQHLLGMPRRDQVHNSISRQRLPRYGRPKAYFYLVSEFETYLRSRRVKYLWTVDQGDGTYQMLSESLFVIFQNFFFPRGGHVCLLVEPMRKSHINSFLSSHGLHKSVFERFNLREEDGSICRMSSHQFRHWLNDIADKGGLPTELLTRWMGRDNPRDTQVYKHATMDERLEWVKAGIRSDQFHGPMTDVYFELPALERDHFLDGQIQAVHFTPMGVCLHDFAVEPCPYHLNCVRGCTDYLRTKGNPQERQHLIQLHTHTEQALTSAQQQADQTEGTLAQAWVKHHQETLQGLRWALAVDDDETIEAGQLTSPSRLAMKGTEHGTQE